MNSLSSEKPASLDSPQGHRNGVEDVQKTKKKTLLAMAYNLKRLPVLSVTTRLAKVEANQRDKT